MGHQPPRPHHGSKPPRRSPAPKPAGRAGGGSIGGPRGTAGSVYTSTTGYTDDTSTVASSYVGERRVSANRYNGTRGDTGARGGVVQHDWETRHHGSGGSVEPGMSQPAPGRYNVSSYYQQRASSLHRGTPHDRRHVGNESVGAGYAARSQGRFAHPARGTRPVGGGSSSTLLYSSGRSASAATRGRHTAPAAAAGWGAASGSSRNGGGGGIDRALLRSEVEGQQLQRVLSSAKHALKAALHPQQQGAQRGFRGSSTPGWKLGFT